MLATRPGKGHGTVILVLRLTQTYEAYCRPDCPHKIGWDATWTHPHPGYLWCKAWMRHNLDAQLHTCIRAGPGKHPAVFQGALSLPVLYLV